MDNIEILAGSSLPLPEQDDPDIVLLNQEASVKFDETELIDAIGTLEFKETYTMVINGLRQLPIIDQKELCLNILNKIKEVYEYSFLPYPKLENQIDFNNVYDLIKFLNFDHIDFFGDVWRYLKTDLKTTNIKQFCEKNSDLIIIEIEDQLNSIDLSEMVSLFLRTYNKSNLISWFIEATEKNKMLIYLRIMEDS